MTSIRSTSVSIGSEVWDGMPWRFGITLVPSCPVDPEVAFGEVEFHTRQWIDVAGGL